VTPSPGNLRMSRSGGGPRSWLVTIRRYRCAGCAHVWRQDSGVRPNGGPSPHAVAYGEHWKLLCAST
jgi:hypothetical protein